MSKPIPARQALALILLLAIVLRIWGIAWGLPSANHYYSYHPDESLVVGTAISMDIRHGHFLPHFYNYGSLQIYLMAFATELASGLGVIKLAVNNLATDYPNFAGMILVARLLTLLMGVGTVWVTYTIGRRLWGQRAGLLAAFLLAIMPLHVQQSHWATVDVPGTFWGMLAILWAARIAQGDPRIFRAAAICGLFAGLAAATKYNFALAILPTLLAVLLVGRAKKSAIINVGVALISAAAAFLAACPGSVLENGTFLTALRTEALHVGSQAGETFEQTGSGFVYHIATNLAAGLGWPLLLLIFASIAHAAKRRERGDGLLAAFAIPYYIVISLAAVRYARYDIPLLPVLALWAGRAIADWSRSNIVITKYRNAILAGAVSVLTLAYTIWLIQPMAAVDPRDQALAWMSRNNLQNGAFAFPKQPWFQTVPLSPYFTAPKPGLWQRYLPSENMNQFLYRDNDWNQVVLNNVPPPIVVVSEYDYKDALRLNDPNAIAYLKRLKSDYQPPITFGSHPLLGRHVNLPHDMLYTDPIIKIYRPK